MRYFLLQTRTMTVFDFENVVNSIEIFRRFCLVSLEILLNYPDYVNGRGPQLNGKTDS